MEGVVSVVVYVLNINLCSILLYTVRSMGLQISPQHRTSFLYQLVQFLWVPGSNAASPTDGCKADGTLYHRLVKDTQHLGADIEGPKLPQEVQKYSLLCAFLKTALALYLYSSATSTSSPWMETVFGLLLVILKSQSLCVCVCSRFGDCFQLCEVNIINLV